MKTIPFLAALFLFPLNSTAMEWKGGQLVDLTHSYNEQTIYWPTEKGFALEKEFEGMTEKGYFYAANRFCTPEHGGTHLDAPFHFAGGRETVEEIPLEKLVGTAILVDVRANDYRPADEDRRRQRCATADHCDFGSVKSPAQGERAGFHPHVL